MLLYDIKQHHKTFPGVLPEHSPSENSTSLPAFKAQVHEYIPAGSDRLKRLDNRHSDSCQTLPDTDNPLELSFSYQQIRMKNQIPNNNYCVIDFFFVILHTILKRRTR